MIKGGDNNSDKSKTKLSYANVVKGNKINESVKKKNGKKSYANVVKENVKSRNNTNAVEPIEINKYIKKLRKQIENSKKIYFVFLDLKDINEIGNLTNLLQDEKQLIYFFKNINHKNPIKLRGINWGVWVTGFKYGATKDSDRKLGLVAYNIKKRGNFKKKFTTVMFFDSENFNEETISEKIGEMEEYLEDPSSRSGENYIKPSFNNSVIKPSVIKPSVNKSVKNKKKTRKDFINPDTRRVYRNGWISNSNSNNNSSK